MDYGTAKWKKKRSRILRIDGYKDAVAGRYGRVIAADTVHHIFPADKYPEYAWEDWNLISVSTATHNKLHKRGSRELSAEGLRLMRRTKPGKDWRKRNGTKA